MPSFIGCFFSQTLRMRVPSGSDLNSGRHCEERSDEAIQLYRGKLDCFAEPVIGRRFAPTRSLAMTAITPHPATSKSPH
jgi:hypothetical protein